MEKINKWIYWNHRQWVGR